MKTAKIQKLPIKKIQQKEKVISEDKEKVIQLIMRDYGYSKKELLKWKWVNIWDNPKMAINVFFDGNYIFFAEDKEIWYQDG